VRGKGRRPVPRSVLQRPGGVKPPALRTSPALLAHRVTLHVDPMGVVNQTVEDAVGDGGIADLLVPSGHG
jgi:hypothetical protein